MQHKHFLHNHPNFPDLIQIVATQLSIDPVLVEKDYWIMHCLYGLQQLHFTFELKGGTSLSKGFGIIHRFSEDIDIRIEPPKAMNVMTGRNHDKPAHCIGRKHFYDWLAKTINIDGIQEVQRDTDFDDSERYRSGGIRLSYKSDTRSKPGLKDGILLEVGFDDVTPNLPKDISSWAYDYAVDKVAIIDNRAKSVACYHLGYTLVEKLQTISTKFRIQQESGKLPKNFMRHYYDVFYLLQASEVQAFIGTEAYHTHKRNRFRTKDNLIIAQNEAFLLQDRTVRDLYRQSYEATRALYYQGQPDFDEVMSKIQGYINDL